MAAPTKPSPSELDAALASLKRKKTYALDLETTGLDPHEDTIIGVALATDDGEWYFTPRGGPERRELFHALEPIFLDERKLAVFHNAKFDLEFLTMSNVEFRNQLGDTMVLAHYLDENRLTRGALSLKGKGSLTEELFGVVLDTYEQSALAGNLFGKDEATYAKDDVKWTLKCWKKLLPSLKRQKLTKPYFEIAMPLLWVLVEMELSGMHIDSNFLYDFRKQLENECEDIERHFNELVGRRVKLGSPQVLSQLFFEELKWEPKPWMERGKNGLYGTSESVISHYASEGHEEAQLVLDYRSKMKMLGTYVRPFRKLALRDAESRIHTSLNSTGTVTGRLCVSGDTLLQTSAGTFEVSRLDLTKHPECSILTHKGRMRRILRKFYKGKEFMYDVITHTGKHIKCTAGHRLMGRFGWSDLRSLSVGDDISVFTPTTGRCPETFGGLYGDTLRGEFSLLSSARGFLRQCVEEVGRQQNTVLSCALRIRKEIRNVDERTRERQLFKGNEGKQTRGTRTAGRFVGKGETPRASRCRVGRLYDSLFDEHDSVYRPSEYKLLRSVGDWHRSSEIADIPGGLQGIVGGVLSGDFGEGEKLPQGQARFLRRPVSSLFGCFGSVGCCEESDESSQQCSSLRGCSEESYCLEDQPWGTHTRTDPLVGRYRTCAGIQNRPVSGRFLVGRSCGRSGRRYSQGTGSTFERQTEIGFLEGARLSRVGFEPFSCGETAEGSSHYGTFSFERIVAIVPVGVHDVWDIEVDEDHSYVAQGLVHHNSSSSPNMQNIPRSKGSMRKAFTAPEGKVIVDADYSQLELRLMAHRSQDERMLEIYNTGGDIHDMTQTMLTIEERTVAKNINFGLIYDMSPKTFKQTLWNKNRIVKSLDECTRWSYGFFETYPGVKRYHYLIEAQLQERGYVTTLTGRRRRLDEELKLNWNRGFRQAVNATIQGSAADIINIAMRNFREALLEKRREDPRWNEVLMLLQVHDELILEAPEELGEEAAELLRVSMENVTTLSVPLIAEPAIGYSWEDAK